MKKWKKLLVSLLTMVIALSCEPIYGLEVQAAERENFAFSVFEDGVKITRYRGSDCDVEIPSQINGNKVTSIGQMAFNGCSGLKSITIPNSITSIEMLAFRGCSSLTSITIPSSVTHIENSILSRCSSLANLTVEEGNSRYDSRDNCNAIIDTMNNMLICGSRNTVIPSSVLSIGKEAFSECNGLTSITIPKGVLSIGEYAFTHCRDLTSITIPEGVESIGLAAFNECSSLTNVTIPKSVTSIGDSAFEGCNENLVIYGVGGSVAESYAKENEIKFERITCIDIKQAVVTLTPTSYVYDGTAKEPFVTVKMDGKTLVYNTDYTVEYSNNINAGTANVKVKGKGDYTGSVEKTFVIHKKDISGIGSTIQLEKDSYIYDGNPKTPSVMVKMDGKTLVYNTDYTVEYSNNINAGTANVKVKGKGDYTGSVEKTFVIHKKDISGIGSTIQLEKDSYIYDGEPKTPSVTVRTDKILIPEVDYIVSYSDNVKVGIATVTVTGIGEYCGNKSLQFSIEDASTDDTEQTDISKADVSLSQSSYVYDGKEKRPSVTVKMDGKTLVYGTDYTVEYSNNINVGTAIVTVTGKGSYTGNKISSFSIIKAGEQSDPKITCKKTMYKVTFGTRPFKIDATSKSKMTFTSSTPKIVIVNKSTGMVSIKNTGVAIITIKAGNTTKKVTIKVSPKKPSVPSGKIGKGKKLIVKLAKDKTASGYQVQIDRKSVV